MAVHAAQDWWDGRRNITRFNNLTRSLVADAKATPPLPHTIAAHILNVKDPATG